MQIIPELCTQRYLEGGRHGGVYVNRAGCGRGRLPAVVAVSRSQELALTMPLVSCSQRGLAAQTLSGWLLGAL